MRTRIVVPTLPTNPSLQDLIENQKRLIVIVQELADRLRPANNQPFVKFANLTLDYTLDADSTTLGEVADVLGTLIEVLKKTQTIS